MRPSRATRVRRPHEPAGHEPAGHEPARALARRYIRFGIRSVAEVRAYLQARGVSVRNVAHVVAELQAARALDDRVCAILLARHLADRGFSTVAIRQRLAGKGIAERFIAAVPEANSPGEDEARARALVESRLIRRHPPRTPTAQRQRLARFLSQRGFDPDIIDRVLAEQLPE